MGNDASSVDIEDVTMRAIVAWMLYMAQVPNQINIFQTVTSLPNARKEKRRLMALMLVSGLAAVIKLGVLTLPCGGMAMSQVTSYFLSLMQLPAELSPNLATKLCSESVKGETKRGLLLHCK